MKKKIDLDHIAINIKDKMDEAFEQFTKLGFTLSPRGFHSLGSINFLSFIFKLGKCFIEKSCSIQIVYIS